MRWGRLAGPLCVIGAACAKPPPPPGPLAGDAGTAARIEDTYTPLATAAATAEDRRRSSDVTREARTSENVRVRRRAAQALARIGDALSSEGLLERLSDDDPEVVVWAAYGLGFACRGREESHVRALSARAVTLRARPAPPESSRGLSTPTTSIARAIGRCGGPLAEQVLVAWAKERVPESRELTRAAVLGLGDLAARRKELSESAQAALTQAAEDGASDMAFYGLSRVELDAMLKPRVLAAARVALGKVQGTRIFAIKALGRCGPDAVPDLVHVVESSEMGPSERAEAARTLGVLGEPGHVAAAELLSKLAPTKDPFAVNALGGATYAILTTLVTALGAEPPKRATAPLNALANLEAPGEPAGSLARRIADLRCQAATALANGAYDADVIKKCAPQGSYPSDRARLAALVKPKRGLTGERRTAWRALAKSEHIRVREAALEAADGHPELGEAARSAIGDALATDKAGLVATAADAINAHPERVLVLAEIERRNALDPRAPPPGPEPQREVDRELGKKLRAALERKWAPDLFETRMSLLDAAVAVALPGVRSFAELACHDPNVTVRERGQKALKALGDAAAACPPPDDPGPAADEVGKLEKASSIILETDSGKLTLRLSPDLAPVTAARLTALAHAGFYKGIVFHRVVPGFVAQLGDPQGDGFGGSGTPLRCETSPSPFAPLDIGMALAGRDTGSSQFFVTLSRTVHLDGDYTKVGRAEGDWYAVAEGDVIREVRVEE